MKLLKLKQLAPVVHRRNDWKQMEDGSFRCGNVLIRNDGGTGIRSNWRIYRVEQDGRLTLIHPKSRPWGYGHSGQAKIGASHMGEPVEGKERAA